MFFRSSLATSYGDLRETNSVTLQYDSYLCGGQRFYLKAPKRRRDNWCEQLGETNVRYRS